MATQYDLANWVLTFSEPYATIFASAPANVGGFMAIYRITNDSPEDVFVLAQDTSTALVVPPPPPAWPPVPGIVFRLKGVIGGKQSSIDVSAIKVQIWAAQRMQPNSRPVVGTYQLICCAFNNNDTVHPRSDVLTSAGG